MAEEPFKVNPLMVQYLTGLSNDLGAYGADTSKGFQLGGVNKVTNDQIKAQGFMKLLQSTLGPDGSSMTVGKDGIKISATNDSKLFKDILGDVGAGIKTSNDVAEPEPVETSAAAPSAPAAQPTATVPKLPNPFTLSPINLGGPASNLAGLTPENIMAAIGAKQTQDQLKMQSYRDLVDSIYKGNAMQVGATKEAREAEAAPIENAYKKALTDKAKADIENDKAIYQVPDSNIKLNAKDWIAYQKMNKETQTPTIKNYEYAQGQGYTGSLIEFQDAARTTHKKDYDEAVKSGYDKDFNTWMLDMAKAGAINLGDLMKKESELTKLQGEKYFANPDWTKDLQSHMGSKDMQNRLFDVPMPELDPKATKEQKQKAYKDATTKERAKVTIEFIEGKIAAGGGKVIANPTMAKDGKTVTWKVQWPTGNITEVVQAVR